MEEFNFIVLLVLLISVFFLHSKLNRIENLLKKTLQKDDEKITVEPPEKIATPISPDLKNRQQLNRKLINSRQNGINSATGSVTEYTVTAFPKSMRRQQHGSAVQEF